MLYGTESFTLKLFSRPTNRGDKSLNPPSGTKHAELQVICTGDTVMRISNLPNVCIILVPLSAAQSWLEGEGVREELKYKF